ncbi:helix-turn-helix domain-containing protein [Flavobacterium sp. JP2137]|uniref:AraC family transcriptional regulator n=1 Tax=Flavobacterium sp. JP2137 TaxID=3414510 RepID=UPI003D2FB4DF
MKIEMQNERYRPLSRVMQQSADYALPEGVQLLETQDVIAEAGFFQRSEQLQLPGVRLSFYERTQSEAIETAVSANGSYLQMHFEISGGSAYYHPNSESGKAIETQTGAFSFFYMPELDGRLRDPICQSARSLEIEVGRGWLEQHLSADSQTAARFLQAMADGQPALLGGRSHRISAPMRQTIAQMYHCPYSGQVKRLFIEGKLLTLLGLQLDQAQQKPRAVKRLVLTAKDRERLHFLREQLTKNFSNHHPLEELVALAAMNRTKLQAGFKQLFGRSIHEFLVQTRMDEAYRLLTTTTDNSLTIASLAAQVGYSHYNHFSAAFKKRFGSPPSRFLNV